jgi:hypothetical protein
MDICMKRSVLLASDQTDFLSSRSPSATIHQLADLEFSVPTDPSVDWNLMCLDTLDLALCEGCYNSCHSDTLVDPLLACCLKSLIIDIMIYISTDPLNWWCYFLSRRQYVAWCAKIDHLVLTFPHWLLHMLYWRSRIILCLICSSSLSLFRWTLNCLDITTTS